MIGRLKSWAGDLFGGLWRLLSPRYYSLRYAIAEADGQQVVLVCAPKSLGGEFCASYTLAENVDVQQAVAWLLESGIPFVSIWQIVDPKRQVRTMLFLPLTKDGKLRVFDFLRPVGDPDEVFRQIGHPEEGGIAI